MTTASTQIEEMSSTPSDKAIQMLARGHLHQHIWLPQTGAHERLRVTFSTTSNFGDESLPAFLFIVPMFGSRYHTLNFEKLSQSSGVRGIAIDRPGIGGSTAVPVENRLGIWLETVPALLKHLKLRHVSLVTHSAGTLYTLNTLVHMPDILDPERPFVAFIAPWVHSEHSKVALTNLVSKLPSGAFSVWGDINVFFGSISPAVSWSSGVVSSIGGLFTGDKSDAEQQAELEAQDRYGVDAATAKAIENLSFKYVVAESLKGGGDEALLCSKARSDLSWLACDDYKSTIRKIAAISQTRLSTDPRGARLKVSLHFAEDDIMIGKGGQKYFEECWQQDEVKSSVDVASKEYKGTNHDSVVVKSRTGALPIIFEQMGERHRQV